MTLEEAQKVASAAWWANGGGCESCAHQVATGLGAVLPQFDWHALVDGCDEAETGTPNYAR